MAFFSCHPPPHPAAEEVFVPPGGEARADARAQRVPAPAPVPRTAGIGAGERQLLRETSMLFLQTK